MDRERWDHRCELGILGLVLAIILYAPLALGAVRERDFLVVQGLTWGALALWGVRLWLTNRYHLLWPPVCWAIVACVGYVVVSYQRAPVEFYARREFLLVLVCASLFFVVLNNLHRQESLQILSLALIAVAVVIAAVGIYQYLGKAKMIWDYPKPLAYGNRASGTFVNPNHFAAFLELIFPLGLCYVLMGRFSHAVKVLLGYAVFMMLLGVGMSLSRTGWLTSGLVLGCLFAKLLKQRQYRLPALALLCVLLMGGGTVMLKLASKEKRIQALAKPSQIQDVRPLLYEGALKIWRDHFWWGAGAEHVRFNYPKYRPTHVQYDVDMVHSEYLQVLMDYGLVGGLIFLVVGGLFFWEVWKIWPYVQRAQNDLSSKRSNKSALVLGGVLGILALLIHALVDFHFHIEAVAIVTVIVAAMVISHARFATERYWVTLGLPVKSLVSLAGLGLLFYLGINGVNHARSYAYRKAALQPGIPAEKSLALLTQAGEVDPRNPKIPFQIGEGYRFAAFQAEMGTDIYYALEAMKWYQKAIEINPLDPKYYISYGMCLDWIKDFQGSEKYFAMAHQLDPNSYHTAGAEGWHLLQLRQYHKAMVRLSEAVGIGEHDLNNPWKPYFLQAVQLWEEERRQAK